MRAKFLIRMNKKLIVSLISLAVSLALVFFCITPLWSSIQVLRSEQSEKQEEVDGLEELSARIQQLDQEYQDLGEDANKFFLALPEEEDIPRLLIQFESLAQSNGLLLESIRFSSVQSDQDLRLPYRQLLTEQSGQPQTTGSAFDKMSVDLQVSGSYEAFKNYLRNLENNVRSMDVYMMDFSTRSGSGEEVLGAMVIFEFNLGVNVYFAKTQ